MTNEFSGKNFDHSSLEKFRGSTGLSFVVSELWRVTLRRLIGVSNRKAVFRRPKERDF